MSIETLQILLSIGGLIAAAVTLFILYFQLRGIQKSLRTASHAAMYEQAAGFRSHLVQAPNLRKYFFDGEEIAATHHDYNRVVTLAEIYLNYLEHIAVLGDSFGRENRPALERFTRTALEKSPILQKHLSENQALYSDALVRYVNC